MMHPVTASVLNCSPKSVLSGLPKGAATVFMHRRVLVENVLC